MSLSVDIAVVLQLRVLQAAIELIKTTATQDAQEQVGSVPSQSAPHRAMFQKRKGIAGEYQKCNILVPSPVCITFKLQF